jgi:transposase
MSKERKHFTTEEKVAILRRHLVDKVLVSELCEQLGLRPTVFYRWQKELFRERSRRFSVSGASPSPSGGEAETDRVLGEEGADQG